MLGEVVPQTPIEFRAATITELYGWIGKNMESKPKGFVFTPEKRFQDIVACSGFEDIVINFLSQPPSGATPKEQLFAARDLIFQDNTNSPGKINECGDISVGGRKMPLHGELKWTKSLLALLSDPKYTLPQRLQSLILVGALVKQHPFYEQQIEVLEHAETEEQIAEAFENLRIRHAEVCIISAKGKVNIDFGVHGGGHHHEEGHDHEGHHHDEKDDELSEEEKIQMLHEAYQESGFGLLVNGMRKAAGIEIDKELNKNFVYEAYDLSEKPNTLELQALNAQESQKLLTSMLIARSEIADAENDHVALALTLMRFPEITLEKMQEIQAKLAKISEGEVKKLSHDEVSVLLGSVGELQIRFDKENVLVLEELFARSDLSEAEKNMVMLVQRLQKEDIGFFLIHNTPASMQLHMGFLHAKEVDGMPVACTSHAYNAKETAEKAKNQAQQDLSSVQNALQLQKPQSVLSKVEDIRREGGTVGIAAINRLPNAEVKAPHGNASEATSGHKEEGNQGADNNARSHSRQQRSFQWRSPFAGGRVTTRVIGISGKEKPHAKVGEISRANSVRIEKQRSGSSTRKVVRLKVGRSGGSSERKVIAQKVGKPSRPGFLVGQNFHSSETNYSGTPKRPTSAPRQTFGGKTEAYTVPAQEIVASAKEVVISENLVKAFEKQARKFTQKAETNSQHVSRIQQNVSAERVQKVYKKPVIRTKGAEPILKKVERQAIAVGVSLISQSRSVKDKRVTKSSVHRATLQLVREVDAENMPQDTFLFGAKTRQLQREQAILRKAA